MIRGMVQRCRFQVPLSAEVWLIQWFSLIDHQRDRPHLCQEMDETLSFYGVSGDSGFGYSLLSCEGILQRFVPDVEFFFPPDRVSWCTCWRTIFLANYAAWSFSQIAFLKDVPHSFGDVASSVTDVVSFWQKEWVKMEGSIFWRNQHFMFYKRAVSE